ncbi:hypothetical protein [Clostridioides sp. ZZV15-6597]|uniref:hypothetical protein n=1 Tax=Clostridioides sp. ZZV15-6597 TaxID=2811500 RepID=UPI001D12071B|nr:hypothetical protein [Clostridioides sp. ZZV15-6597]
MAKLEELKLNIKKLKESINDNFDIDTIPTYFEKIKLNKKVKSYKDAEALIYQINLLELFNINASTQERFSCIFFKRCIVLNATESVKDLNLSPKNAYDALKDLSNRLQDRIGSKYTIIGEYFEGSTYTLKYIVEKEFEAYVLKNNNGYRYYLNTTKRDMNKITFSKEKPSFTLIDLIRIFFDLDFFEAIDYICTKVGIIVAVKNSQIKRVNKNKELINDTKYVELHRLLDDKFYLIDLFYNRSIKYCFSQETFDNQPVFYYPVRTIEKDISDLYNNNPSIIPLKTGPISSMVRILILLGLLSTIDHSKLKTDFKFDKADNKYFNINAYYIPLLNEKVLDRAEKIAEKINANNLCISKLNHEKCLKVLGKRHTAILFKNSTIRKNNKIAYEEKTTKELIEAYESSCHESII